VRFLVTFALAEEFAPWRKRSGFQVGGRGETARYRRRRDGIEWEVVVTGAGSDNASRAAARALAGEPFDLTISAGLAGGLRPEHRPGTVLVARQVLRLADGRALDPAPEWTRLAVEHGAREVVLVTADRVAVAAEEKRRLGQMADAVEMESFAVLEAAAARGVPATAIRTVSDPVETELPVDFNRVLDASGRVRGAALAGELVRRPTAMGGLLRLAKESRRAAGILGEFLERYTRAAAETAAART
jgi:adenosylhomocysteine nucleosidase